jgi:hypothetical protein
MDEKEDNILKITENIESALKDYFKNNTKDYENFTESIKNE